MFTFLSVKFFQGDYNALLKRLREKIEQRERFYVCVTSVHGLVEAQKDVKFQTILNSALFTVPDGMPIVWAGKRHSKKTTRIYGPQLMDSVCGLAESQQYKIYLYGTTQKTLSALQEKLKKKFPRLRIAGSLAPPFGPLSDENKRKIYTHINNSHAQIVFVGLSTPKQEMWMSEARPHLHASMLIGVGAAFDFLSGIKRQAPKWIQQSGLEWLFRLIKEPKRLGRRYLINNALFIWFLIQRILKRNVYVNKKGV